MLSVYSFKQRVIPVVTMIIFATLAMAMTAQSASAQPVLPTINIGEARGLLRDKIFLVETFGCALEPSQVDVFRFMAIYDNGWFEGKYYRYKSTPPVLNNVHGSIILVTGRLREGGTALTVGFTVNQGIVDGVGVEAAYFKGALRFCRSSLSAELFPFMAGTFTLATKENRPRTGPFPFSARVN